MPKAKQYRYLPKDNKTPVNHPVLGHLEYGTIVDDRAAGLPDFEPVQAPRKARAPKKAAPVKPAPPAGNPPAAEPSAEQTDAGNAGRSK